MFSNFSEIDWRKIDNDSIKIVEGDRVGDKIRKFYRKIV
jgi:hypothetical protein